MSEMEEEEKEEAQAAAKTEEVASVLDRATASSLYNATVEL